MSNMRLVQLRAHSHIPIEYIPNALRRKCIRRMAQFECTYDTETSVPILYQVVMLL